MNLSEPLVLPYGFELLSSDSIANLDRVTFSSHETVLVRIFPVPESSTADPMDKTDTCVQRLEYKGVFCDLLPWCTQFCLSLLLAPSGKCNMLNFSTL